MIFIKNDAYLKSDTSVNGDERYTPYYAVEPILEFLPSPQPNCKIWCPFDEDWSAFVQCLRGAGYTVINSSLRSGQDFFSYEPPAWDVLISNPPFSKKDAVLKRAYELGKPFALLLPANSIQGKSRFRIFQNDIQMLCFDSRIGFHDKQHMNTPVEGCCFGSAYFCRNFLPSKLELRELHKFNKPLNAG